MSVTPQKVSLCECASFPSQWLQKEGLHPSHHRLWHGFPPELRDAHVCDISCVSAA